MEDFLAQAMTDAQRLADEQNARTQRDNRWLNELDLQDGEVVTVRVVPTPPFTYAQHAMVGVNGQKFGNAVCTGQGCRGCEAAAALDAAGVKSQQSPVKGASPRAAFLFFSFRPAFLVPTTSDSGKQYLRREIRRITHDKAILVYDKATKAFSRQAAHPLDAAKAAGTIKVVPEGLKVWDCSTHDRAANGSVLFDLHKKFNSRCMCNTTIGADSHDPHPAEVKPKGHACAGCGKNVMFSSAQGGFKCPHCQSTARPNEVLSCEANCPNPRRVGLNGMNIRITRKGTGTNTAYNFEPMPPSELDPIVKAAIYKDGGVVVNTIGVLEGGNTVQKTLKEIYQGKPEAMLVALRQRVTHLQKCGVALPGITAIGGAGESVPLEGGGFDGFDDQFSSDFGEGAGASAGAPPSSAPQGAASGMADFDFPEG